MSEHDVKKPRQCRKCELTFYTTAEEIKEHKEICDGKTTDRPLIVGVER